MINNLSQVKKAINSGRTFEVVKHYIRPDNVGQIRKPNKVQTNGFYSVVVDEPNNQVTKANNGKGA